MILIASMTKSMTISGGDCSELSLLSGSLSQDFPKVAVS